MNHADIEYIVNPDGTKGFSWNFFPGCLHKQQGKCPVPHCWAEGMWRRIQAAAKMRGEILPNFDEPHLIPEKLLDPLKRKKPAVIFADVMGDLGGEWVDPKTLVDVADNPLFGTNEKHGRCWELSCIISDVMFSSPQHTFLFLTKNPSAWAKWGVWPDNAWMGATVWDWDSFIGTLYDPNHGMKYLRAKHKWLSIEPLLDKLEGQCKLIPSHFKSAGIEWVVIGAQSNPTVLPRIEWVKEIVEAADRAGVKVWLKDNLIPMFGEEDTPEWGRDSKGYFRQEKPWEEKP